MDNNDISLALLSLSSANKEKGRREEVSRILGEMGKQLKRSVGNSSEGFYVGGYALSTLACQLANICAFCEACLSALLLLLLLLLLCLVEALSKCCQRTYLSGLASAKLTRSCSFFFLQIENG